MTFTCLYFLISIFSLSLVYSYEFILHSDFIRITASNMATDNVTNLVKYRIFTVK